MFACIASSLYRNAAFAEREGYKNVEEVREGLTEVASVLIDHGSDLTVCYNQPSMIDMDASAFAFMFGVREIAEAIIAALYGDDERLAAGARAEAIEVALGNCVQPRKASEKALSADPREKCGSEAAGGRILGLV